MTLFSRAALPTGDFVFKRTQSVGQIHCDLVCKVLRTIFIKAVYTQMLYWWNADFQMGMKMNFRMNQSLCINIQNVIKSIVIADRKMKSRYVWRARRLVWLLKKCVDGINWSNHNCFMNTIKLASPPSWKSQQHQGVIFSRISQWVHPKKCLFLLCI